MSSPAPFDDPRLARARMLARALDSAMGVPGTGMRFGLDPILGLIPGLGDFAGAAASGYIVLTAIRLGAPRTVVVRMVGNVALDTVIGSVPLLGDLFDAGWKANNRNVALIERHVGSPEAARKSSAALVAVVVIALILLAIGGIALTVMLLKSLAGLF